MQFNVNGETVEFLAPMDLLIAESCAMEKVTGLTFKEIGASMARGSMLATKAWLWVSYKRVHPEAKFSDLDDWPITAATAQAAAASVEVVEDPSPAVAETA